MITGKIFSHRLGTALGTWPDDVGGGGGGGELEALETYLSQNLFSWIRADTFTQSGGKITAFQDKVASGVGARAIDASHAYSQSTDAQRWTPSTDAALDDKEVAVSSQLLGPYVSSLAASHWACTEDGSGFESWTVCKFTALATIQALLQTSGTDSSGMNLVHSAGDLYLALFQAGADPLSYTVIGPALATNTAYVVNVRHATASSPQRYGKVTGKTAVSGAYANAPASENPATTMLVGNNAAIPNIGLTGNFAETMITKTLSPTMQANVASYLLLRYGLAP
jgi:hypothetical protein